MSDRETVARLLIESLAAARGMTHEEAIAEHERSLRTGEAGAPPGRGRGLPRKPPARRLGRGKLAARSVNV